MFGSSSHGRQPEGVPPDSEPVPVRVEQTLSLLEVRSETRHAVEGEIGRGGMGAVHRVHDKGLLRDVALKSAGSDALADSEAIASLLREAQITGQLEHPHIVPIYDVSLGPDANVAFTMKLVRGQTLTRLVDALHDADWDDAGVERVLRVILKICDALAFAHSRRVVHCDVKPENVMVGDFGQVYLMDWGVALLQPAGDGSRNDVEGGEPPSVMVGTLEYMAPEQFPNATNPIDARTDVFGVGGLLYHLLTGCGPNFKTLSATRPPQPYPVLPPEELGAWPNLPPELCRITLKALAFAPEDRYQTVAELQAELEESLRGGGWFITRRYPAGAVIIQQGDTAHEAYMLVKGICEVTKKAGESHIFLRRLQPGDVFGETAILTREPRTARVAAVTEVVVKVVTADAFEREFTRRSWAGVFVHAIASRFRDVDEQASSRR